MQGPWAYCVRSQQDGLLLVGGEQGECGGDTRQGASCPLPCPHLSSEGRLPAPRLGIEAPGSLARLQPPLLPSGSAGNGPSVHSGDGGGGDGGPPGCPGGSWRAAPCRPGQFWGEPWPEPCGAEGQRWACAEEASLSSEAWRGESGSPPPLEGPLGGHRDGKVPWASVS